MATDDSVSEEYITAPQWVREWENSLHATRLREAVNAEVNRMAELLIKYEGPKFVAEFLRELAFSFEASKRLGFSGSVTPKAEPDSDHICRVEVILPGNFPKLTTTDVFYRDGDSEIRFYTLEKMTFSLKFFVHSDGLRVRRDNSITALDPRDAANFVIKGMCKRLST